MRTLLALLVSVPLLLGCPPPTLVVPSQTIPHRLSKECRTEIEVGAPNGQVERQKVTIPAGWWVASPGLVETDAK